MMHTPAEARELWCPMVRTVRRETSNPERGPEPRNLELVGGCNSDALGRLRVPASCRCIADQCAMWRWVPSTTVHKEPRVQESQGLRYVQNVDVPDAPTHGYCGIGGIPALGV